MTDIPSPAALVPHAGSMCLLDRVGSWSETSVTCFSASHRRADHPLRRGGCLPAIHLLEYAAQASAVHAGLTAGAGASAALKYLAAARDFHLQVSTLDEVAAELCIDADQLMDLCAGQMYHFSVSAAGRLLAAGRLTVVAAASDSL